MTTVATYGTLFDLSPGVYVTRCFDFLAYYYQFSLRLSLLLERLTLHEKWAYHHY